MFIVYILYFVNLALFAPHYGQNDSTSFTSLIKYLYFIFPSLILNILFNDVIKNNTLIFLVYLVPYT